MNKYFSYDPVDNEFETHPTLAEAREHAEHLLQESRVLAIDEGVWDFSVEDIQYGLILGGAKEIPCDDSLQEYAIVEDSNAEVLSKEDWRKAKQLIALPPKKLKKLLKDVVVKYKCEQCRDTGIQADYDHLLGGLVELPCDCQKKN